MTCFCTYGEKDFTFFLRGEKDFTYPLLQIAEHHRILTIYVDLPPPKSDPSQPINTFVSPERNTEKMGLTSPCKGPTTPNPSELFVSLRGLIEHLPFSRSPSCADSEIQLLATGIILLFNCLAFHSFILIYKLGTLCSLLHPVQDQIAELDETTAHRSDEVRSVLLAAILSDAKCQYRFLQKLGQAAATLPGLRSGLAH
jgi:hypothetical protein